LWWGHRIPAWHCQCGEIIVSRETPAKCSKCGKSELKQDTDVLDTWFSSGLLPFTTLGWPEKMRAQEVFYPTTLLITAYEILFFWVARMIMFGCHFMQGHQQDPALKQASGWGDKKDDSVPFRQVYIHALVRDADRQKMSKTKGNVIDPLDIIKRFGTDATRFTLAAMAAPGTDIAFSESRTDGYRAFANKIWNAARFMFMNVDRVDPNLLKLRTVIAHIDGGAPVHNVGVEDFEPVTLEDRWILSRFNSVVAEVNASLISNLGLYRFDNAANSIYDFFWGEFCDWYIELIKPRLMSSNADEVAVACNNLVVLFESSLRLLHPFMPFITEELWQALYDGKPPQQSISLAAYPSPLYKKGDFQAETNMAILQDLIVSVRNLRAELKVEQKQRVPIQVYPQDGEIKSLLEQNRGAIERLANVESMAFVESPMANLPSARSTARFDVHVVYEKKIDVAAERTRLTKELEQIDKEIANSQRQLGNEQFLAKAPAKVVEGMRKRLAELEVLQGKVRNSLDQLRS
jgi:valyl-tRNA synthetase